jgi:cyclopropane-fatty-acyl-phospholipid synthase
VNELNSDPLTFASESSPFESRAGGRDRLAAGLVHRALAPMDKGRLILRLPNGSSRTYGRGEDGPTAEVRVRSYDFFRHCVRAGDIGFGEAYQSGDWDSPDLPAVIGWFCANVESSAALSGSQRRDWLLSTLRFGSRMRDRFRHAFRRNSTSGSRENILAHYDLGNRFYSLWLDPTMTYSAALFDAPDRSLAEAQTAKYERLCQQLRLRSSDHLLEIGSGWGGMACHAARHHGCRVTTITISDEQFHFATERVQREGLADRVKVKLQDYRELRGQFDKIVSIEMLEAVGDAYLPVYFRQVQRLLKRDGIFSAQFITCPDHRYQELRRSVDWIQKHVFPGSLLLSLNRVNSVVQQTGQLSIHALHDLGLDYAHTLRLWRARFLGQLPAVRELGFDERFIRTWDYYLAYCEAAFAWRNISVVQATWAGPNCRSLM